jgi:hypothetical protein
VNGAEVEKLVYQGIAFFTLREDGLQCGGEFAQTAGFRPGVLFAKVLMLGEKAAASVRAFFQTGQKLVAEGGSEQFDLVGFHLR